MSEDPSNRFEEDRRSALRARAEDRAPWLRSIPGPGFGSVLVLILVQLVFTLAAPDEDWANFVSVLLQAAILWTGLVAARIPRGPRRVGETLIAAVVIATAILLLSPGLEIGETVPILITVGLIAFTPLVIVLGVIRSMKVEGTITLHVMYGVLSIYLLLGYAFALIFQVIGDLSSANFFADNAAESGANYLYFAFVTMTTVGYGDLAAAEGIGRAFAIALALTGQIFLVTVVAVIVSNLGARHDASSA
jgi:hypothetical protein